MKATKAETTEQRDHSLALLMRDCQTKALALDARLTILEAGRGTR